MTEADLLVDTSAFARISRSRDLQDFWRPAIDAGHLSVCPINELEILYSAQSKGHLEEIISTLNDSYCSTFMPDRIYQRAKAVQIQLADLGRHRAAGVVDLLVAATAEEFDMTLLQYDSGFEHISEITGQRTQWLAKPGTIP